MQEEAGREQEKEELVLVLTNSGRKEKAAVPADLLCCHCDIHELLPNSDCGENIFLPAGGGENSSCCRVVRLYSFTLFSPSSMA